MRRNWNNLVICAVTAVLLMCITSTGCIKLVQKNIKSPDLPPTLDETGTGSASGPVRTITATPAMPEGVSLPESTVHSAEPILPPDTFRTARNLTGRNGEPANLSLQVAWNLRVPLYSLHYSLRYNASAVEVNVTRGPLVINFRAVPDLNEPRISFARMTVRDLPSRRIVAEEHIDHFPMTDSGEEDSAGSLGEVNNLRQVVLFREGRYHITMYGNQAEVDLTIYTGDSPLLTSTTPGVPDPVLPAEEEEVWA